MEAAVRRGVALALLVVLVLPALALGEGQKEGKETEDEAITKATNAGISIMLLGSVAFMMGLFYLVNHPDADMVKYSWQVISSTISIFSAVLLFQAVNGLVEATFLEDASEGFELAVSIVHFLLWFCLLQYALAYFSGALEKGEQEKGKEAEEKAELQLKSYAILLGHITGFAAINAFGVFQQQVPKTVVCTFMVAPLAWVVVFILSQVMDHVRDSVARGDDGKVDKSEELWDEVTEETEDDVIGLAVSFLVVQTLRLLVGGTLPNAEGEESEEGSSSHSNWQVLMLVVIGTSFVLVEVLRMLYIKFEFPRLTPQMRNIVIMSFSWCIFFATDWWLSYNIFTQNHGMTKEVVVALTVTAIAMTEIFLLDKFADLPVTGSHVDAIIRAVVRALGILIGFSWEKSFDTAVVEVSGFVKVLPDHLVKLVLAVLLVLLVVPAWRLYILPTILMYEKAEEEEEKREEEQKEKEEKEEKERESEEGFSPLNQPLLASGSPTNSRRLKHKSMKMLSPAEGLALQSKCDRYEEHIVSLEERNKGLEDSLQEFVHELSELQQMADILKKA